MSFVFNNPNEQQLSIFDSYDKLTDREKKFLDKSWAKYFAEYIFPKLDEKPYEALYSDEPSRPNTPVNVQLAALVIKEFTAISDEEILLSLMFDIRYQYAFHTTSFLEQPLSDRTLGRFRQRCYAYERETGIDLFHSTMESISGEMAHMMKLDPTLKRMDSLMVASNIKRMSRLELLYTCAANLAKELKKQGKKLPESLDHYTQVNDRNKVIYHNRSEETGDKIAVVLKDAKLLKEMCASDYDESSNYQLLLRVLTEQAVKNEGGSYRLREKADGGMNASILQNPADPDATYREKANKQNRGYVANLTEAADGKNSIITDYQFEQNTYSDSQFMKDALNKVEKQDEIRTIVTDGAYAGEENQQLAKEKNIILVTTNLTGRKAEEILADFEFNEDGTMLLKCAGGHAPKSCNYNGKTGQCSVSFQWSHCQECPHLKECHPRQYKRVAKKIISTNGRERAKQQRNRKSDEFKAQSNFRNGVEALNSTLRRRYHVDHMPVRGHQACKLFFGCKIAALNFKKFCKYMQSLEQCGQKMVLA